MHDAPSVLVVMGVSGSGKTTVAALLAGRLCWEFEDADDLHPAANVAKMHAGIPLTDADRWPWLARGRQLDRCEPCRRPPRRRCLLGAQAQLPGHHRRQPAGRAVGLSQGRSAIDQRPAGLPARPFHAGRSAGESSSRRSKSRPPTNTRSSFRSTGARKQSSMSSCRSSGRCWRVLLHIHRGLARRKEPRRDPHVEARAGPFEAPRG